MFYGILNRRMFSKDLWFMAHSIRRLEQNLSYASCIDPILGMILILLRGGARILFQKAERFTH